MRNTQIYLLFIYLLIKTLVELLYIPNNVSGVDTKIKNRTVFLIQISREELSLHFSIL